MSTRRSYSAIESNDNAAADDNEELLRHPSERELDGEFILKSGAKQIFRLFVPVSICMLLTVITAQLVPFYQKTQFYLIYTPFHTENADAGTTTWQSLANVLIFMAFVIVGTVILVLLFKYKCYKCIHVWLTASTVIILFFLSFEFLHQLISTLNIFFDIPSIFFIIWNFGVAGLLTIHWKGPLKIQQGYLIFVSFQLAIFFMKCVPKWTCWVLLAALSIWDLVAVLAPKGPLRMLVEIAHEREVPLLPALTYATTATFMIFATDEQPQKRPQPTHTSDEAPEVAFPRDEGINFRELQSDLERRDKQGVMLGLGDFIFYSLLIGRASLDSDGTTIVACYVAVLVGMCTTIIILGIMRKALPALPVSIACGILFYFCTSLVMSPFVTQLFNNRIYF
ncbi:hypothetical protein Ciccas_013402 [Cichlidogyrus casuarinus]|uniref:Presenilin n=1 Tax=Cichlidogyrus casuarinus TaxID=1844966 RepID=A0ABD2PKS6_9PLAT